MLGGLFKALFLTAGPGIIVFIVALFINNMRWLAVYAIALTGLILYLYIKAYTDLPLEDSHGWVFSHAVIHGMVILGVLGIFVRFRALKNREISS